MYNKIVHTSITIHILYFSQVYSAHRYCIIVYFFNVVLRLLYNIGHKQTKND